MKASFIIRMLFLICISLFLLNSCEQDPAGEIQLKSMETAVPVILPEDSVMFVDLIGGQQFTVGQVAVSFDETNVYIAVHAGSNWYLKNIHLWIGNDVQNLPLSKPGNPQIGLFPNKVENLADASDYSFTIPWAALGGYNANCGATMYVALHADVQSATGQSGFEGAWASGAAINDHGSWATYFAFRPECAAANISPCCNAWAYGPLAFGDAGFDGSQGGWIYSLTNSGTFTTPLYVQNPLSEAPFFIHVGNVNYGYNGTGLKVEYEMMGGYSLSETHVYASAAMPQSVNPVMFDYTHPVAGSKFDAYYIALKDGPPVYVIAHAVVCSKLPGQD